MVYRNINEENIIKEEKSENESNSNSNSNKEIKIFNIKDNDPDFEKRFLKKLILNENKLGYKLYKAKQKPNFVTMAKDKTELNYTLELWFNEMQFSREELR